MRKLWYYWYILLLWPNWTKATLLMLSNCKTLVFNFKTHLVQNYLLNNLYFTNFDCDFMNLWSCEPNPSMAFAAIFVIVNDVILADLNLGYLIEKRGFNFIKFWFYFSSVMTWKWWKSWTLLMFLNILLSWWHEPILKRWVVL